MQIPKDRLLNALMKLILFSAIIHLLILAVYSIYHLDFSSFNYFSIIDLDLFFPGIGSGILSSILSIISIVTVYLVIYFIFTERKND